MTEGREEGGGKEDQLRFGALIICIDNGIIYYDNDISSIVSNDRIIEADSSISLRTVQYSNRRGGWHGSNVKCDGGKKKKGRRTSSGLGI